MESSVRIRSFEAGDKGRVFTLLSSFYENTRSIHDWEYLYMGNPDGDAVISLAERLPEKNIIGHYSVIKMPTVIFKKLYSAGKGEGEIFDFSALRQLLRDGTPLGRSISVDLLKHTIDSALGDGIALVCTNPSNLALKSHLDAGFKIIKQRFDIFIYGFSVKYFSHLLDKKAGIKMISSITGIILAVISGLLYGINACFYRRCRITLEPFESFGDTTDAFMEEFAARFDCITTQRKQKHLNWRFGRSGYNKFMVKFRGRPIGYIVLHVFINPNGFKETNLVDYLFLPRQWSKFSAVIMEILKIAKKAGCDFMRINHMYDFKERLGVSGGIKRLCFFGRQDRRNIVVFISTLLEAMEDRILDAGNWYFTDLYFEGY